MKKIIISFLIFFNLYLTANADVMPYYINSLRRYGIGYTKVQSPLIMRREAKLEGEILEIENKLKFAVIIKESATKKGTVSLGSKVDFIEEESGEALSYEIVGTTEADVEQGRISNESPIGNALLGRKAGDTVKVAVPAGWTTITIKKVY